MVRLLGNVEASLERVLNYDEAVLIEPIACAVHGMDVIGIKPGDDILMSGAGPTGIILAQLLKHCCAGNLVEVASDRRKLEVVKRLGGRSCYCYGSK